MTELMTPKEAAQALRLAPQTLARWRVEGGGPRYVKLGHRIAYRREDVAEWVDVRLQRSTSQRFEKG